MASTGAKFPTSASSTAETPWDDNTGWSNTGNIYATDGSTAGHPLAASEKSYVLRAGGFDLSSIPSDATIVGAVVVVRASESFGGGRIALCSLLDTAGAIAGTNKASTPQAVTGSLANYTFGGASDLWGNSLTVSWVKDADFGVAVAFDDEGGGAIVAVDSITIDVYYTVPTKTYWIVAPSSGWSDPTKAEIKAGQKSGGAAATASGSSNAPTTDQTDYTIGTPSGLTASTAYKAAAYWDDEAGDTSAVVVSAEFTTSSSGFTSTGALSAQAATVAGTATHLTLHTSSGALAAQAATVSGAAVHPHIATGALEAQAATVSGAAVHPHIATGALEAAAATVSGAALHPHVASGALAAQAATVSGAAVHPHIAVGALEAQAATVSGAAVHPHIATGALEAQAATVDGAASLTIPGGTFASTGALSAQVATVAGTATHLTLHTATGALEAGSATVAGEAEHTAPSTFTATGALEAQSATVAGTATHYTLHTAEGALVAGSASVSGSAVDETTFVPPKPNTGAGKSRKPRKKRYQVEVNGEIHEVASVEEAEAVLEQVAKQAEETAKTAIERASKAKRRPARKVIADARKALEVPEISVPADFRDIANQIIGRIKANYQSALSSIEISAYLARREREIEEDDEDILMLL